MPTDKTARNDPELEKTVLKMFFDSTFYYLVGGFLVDAVILVDAAMVYLFPSLIDDYSLSEIDEKIEESGPFIFLFRPDWLLPYLVGGSSELFVSSQRSFSYILEYFKLDIHSYPSTSWLTHPAQHTLSAKLTLDILLELEILKPFMVIVGFVGALVEMILSVG